MTDKTWKRIERSAYVLSLVLWAIAFYNISQWGNSLSKMVSTL